MRIQVCYAFFLVENAQVLWPQPMFVCCCYTPGNSWNRTTKSFGPSLWCFSDGLPGGKNDVGKGRYFGIKWPADARNVYACICKYLYVSKHFLGRTFSFDMLNSLVCWISHNIGGNKSVWDAAIRILGVNSRHFANLCTLQLLAYEIQFANPADPWNIFGMYNQLCFTNQLKNWLHHVDPWIR